MSHEQRTAAARVRSRSWLGLVLAVSGLGCSTRGAAPATEPPLASPAPPAFVEPPAPLERLFWTTLRPGNWDIYYRDRAGSSPRRLTNDPGPDYDATLSPDGRFVVFCSERRGNPDLYALDLTASTLPQSAMFLPQSYGEVYALRLADGLLVRLTHNKWEDGPKARSLWA